MGSLPDQPTFWVRDIPVYSDLILSPMAGFSDKPYRLICREYGSAMSYSEFVSVHAILNGNVRTWQMLEFDPFERRTDSACTVRTRAFGPEVVCLSQ